MTTLRVLVGVAGVGYSFFANKDTSGQFNYGKIPESIFGQFVGGVFYDWLKDGTSVGYGRLLQSLDSLDAGSINHDLQRAARKSTLLATFFACQGCLTDIKSERQSIWKRFKNVAWKDEDINWLVAVGKSLQEELKNIETATFDEQIDYKELFSIFDENNIANPEQGQKEFAAKLKAQTLADIKNGYYSKIGGQITVPFSENGFELLSEAIYNGWEDFPQDKDFTIQLKLTANGNRVKKYDWFHLVCVIFNEEYKVNEKIEAAMQKQTALEQTALLKKIADFGKLENFGELERQIADFREENYWYHQITHEKLNEILTILRGQMRIFSQPLQVHNLPTLTEKVYGREEEKVKVLEALQSAGRRFSLVVAPSGFGKTRLLAKVLAEFTDGRNVKPEYAAEITRLMLIDCRLVQNLTDITREFNTVLGTQIVFENRLRNYNEAWCKLVFELIDGETWLFFDNFESWLDASEDYEFINIELRAFLNALFSGNHGLRGVILSQSEPESDVLNNLNKLRDVGKQISAGLDRESALLYLRENANEDNGLETAPTDLLVEFLEDVGYIPQAINSLIGYLDSISGYSFTDFMNKQNGFWTKFDEAESDEEALEKGIRRTKALIKQQILRQSGEVKLLMMVLAFFARSVPREGLEILFPDKAQAANPISRLTSHNLATVTTGIRGTKYYELHTYFRVVTRRTLSPIEVIAVNEYAGALRIKADEAKDTAYFNRAIALNDCSEFIYLHLLKKGEDVENSLITIYINNGTLFVDLGRVNDGIEQYKKAIELNNFLIREGKKEAISSDLAMMYWGKGFAFSYLGKLNEAITELDEAITIYEQLFNANDRKVEEVSNLAKVYIVKGSVLSDLDKLDDAVSEYDKAIKIYEESVGKNKQTELIGNLATTYMNKGNTLQKLDKVKESVIEYDKAIPILEELFKGQGKIGLANYLAMAYMNKGVALFTIFKLNEAIAEYDKAIEIYEELVRQGRIELVKELASVYINKGLALQDNFDLDNSLICIDKAMLLRKECLVRGETQILPDYVKGLTSRVGVLIELENWSRIADDALNALDYISFLENPEVPKYFKQIISGQIFRMVLLLKVISPEKREELYKHTGENGKLIRELIDSLPDNQG